MRTRSFAAVLALVLVLTPAATPADPLPTNRSGWIVNGYVDETVSRGNTLLLSGGFTALAPVQNRIGHFVELQPGSGHPVRLPAEVAGGLVQAISDDGSGGWYLGGYFNTVGGAARQYLAHVRADGTLDTGFAPVLNNTVWALLRRGGTLYAAGTFTLVNGEARGAGAAFDIATETLLPWDPQVAGGAAQVQALAVSGSTVLLGGAFTTVGGGPRSGFAAVNDTTGALLPTLGNVSGAGLVVNAVTVRGNTVYLGGGFTAINGVPRANLGAIDLTSGTVLPFQADANSGVSALLASDNGLYVGGAMTTIGGQTRRYLALTDLTTGAVAAWHPDANGNVRTLALSGSALVFGGEFTYVAGNGRAHIAAVEATGSGALTAWNPGLSALVTDLAVSPAGTVAAGGSFSHYGATSRLRLAAIDIVTGQLQPLAARIDNGVFDMDLAGTTLYLAGAFTRVNGVDRLGFAALDVTSGTLLPWNPQANFALGRSLAVSGSTVFLGGFFNSLGGQPRQGFGQVDATTGTPTAFAMNASGTTGVTELKRDGTRLFIGGNFASLGGQTRSGLAVLDTGSNTLTSLAPALAGATVSVAAISPVGDVLYFGGTFASVGGQSRTNAAAVSMSSGAVLPFAPQVDFPIFSIEVAKDTAHIAGNFTTVNGQARRTVAAVDAATGATTRPFSAIGLAGQGRHVAVAPEGLWVGANTADYGQSHLLFFPEAAMGGLPGPPSTPTVNIAGPTLTLRWAPSALGGAPVDYVVEAGTGRGLTNIATLPLGAATPQFTFTPVPGGLYYMRVRARSAAGLGPASADVAFAAGVPGCSGAPQAALGQATVSGANLTLSWEDPVSAAGSLNYTLEAGTAPGLANVATLPLGSTRVFNAAAPPGLYYARVVAASTCGAAAASPEIPIEVGVQRLAPPTVSAQAAGGAVSITWDAVAGATAYVLEAGTGPLRADIVTLPVPTTVLNAAAPPGTYYVRVYATGPTGLSASSKELVLIVP